jgi:hypothetical protein
MNLLRAYRESHTDHARLHFYEAINWLPQVALMALAAAMLLTSRRSTSPPAHQAVPQR